MAEKQEEIRRERARLLEEETKLMEEERRKLQVILELSTSAICLSSRRYFFLRR